MSVCCVFECAGVPVHAHCHLCRCTGEALNCPLDLGVGREVGALSISQVRGMWDQPGPTEEGADLLPEMDHPTLGSSLRPSQGDGQGAVFMAN